jgi:acyl carrier protein
MDKNNFIKIFAGQFDDTDVSLINENTNYKELEEWSSMTALCLIAMAKTEFGKTITGSEIRACDTVKDLYDLLESK